MAAPGSRRWQLEGELGDVLEKSLEAFRPPARRAPQETPLHVLRRAPLDGRLRHRRPADPDAEGSERPQKSSRRQAPSSSNGASSWPRRRHPVRSAALDDLKETLAPIFKDDLGVFFLRWAAENLESSLAGAETFTVTLGKDRRCARAAALGCAVFPRAAPQIRRAQAIEALKAFTDGSETTTYLLRPQRVDIAPAPAAVPAEASEVAAVPEAGESEAGEAKGGKRRRRRRRGGRDRAEGGATEASADAGESDGDEAGDDAVGDDAAPEAPQLDAATPPRTTQRMRTRLSDRDGSVSTPAEFAGQFAILVANIVLSSMAFGNVRLMDRCCSMSAACAATRNGTGASPPPSSMATRSTCS